MSAFFLIEHRGKEALAKMVNQKVQMTTWSSAKNPNLKSLS